MAVRGLCFATASYQWQCNSGPSRTREQDLISRVLMGRSTMRSGSGIPRTAHCSYCFASRALRPDLQYNEDTSFTGQSAQAKSATHDGTKCPEILGPTDHRTRPSPTLMRDTYEKACHNTINERHTSWLRNRTRVVGSATVQQTSLSKRWCVVGTRPGRMSTEQSSGTEPVMVVEKNSFLFGAVYAT